MVFGPLKKIDQGPKKKKKLNRRKIHKAGEGKGDWEGWEKLRGREKVTIKGKDGWNNSQGGQNHSFTTKGKGCLKRGKRKKMQQKEKPQGERFDGKKEYQKK